MYLIRLTPAEHSALLSIIIEHIRTPDSTEKWIDISTSPAGLVTVDDILHKVSLAKVEE